jgi:predicted nucleic acid-binding protein
MKLVIDANVVISALVADSKTRELIVTLKPDLLTPAFVYDELGNYEELIVEKSGMDPDRVAQFIDLLSFSSERIPPFTAGVNRVTRLRKPRATAL